MNDEELAFGELVGGIDFHGGRARRLELRIKAADERHPEPVLLVMRRMADGRVFSIPIFANRAREFAHLVDVALRKLEEPDQT